MAGNSSALGTNITTIDSGATLDVNGQALSGTAQIVVSGSGVGGLGAIINNGASQQNALGSITLAGDTTFGGTNRWDLRPTSGNTTLSTSGQAYNLIKTSTNVIAIVNATVDSALSNIDIQQGQLVYQGSTTGLGDSTTSKLTVEAYASFQFFSATNLLNKTMVLNGTGTGTNDTLAVGSGSGAVNNIIGNINVNGTKVWDMTSRTSLGIQGPVSGSTGSISIKTGAGSTTIGVQQTNRGNTIISNGSWIVDGTQTGPITITTTNLPIVALTNPTPNGGTLAGYSTINGPVTNFPAGTISPGDPAVQPQATLSFGNNLTLDTNSFSQFELSSSSSGVNDLIAITGNLKRERHEHS